MFNFTCLQTRQYNRLYTDSSQIFYPWRQDHKVEIYIYHIVEEVFIKCINTVYNLMVLSVMKK